MPDAEPRVFPVWVWWIGLAFNLSWAWGAWYTHSLTLAFFSGAGTYSSLNWIFNDDKRAARARKRGC